MIIKLVRFLFLPLVLVSCYSKVVKEDDSGYNYYRTLTNPTHGRVVQFLDQASRSRLQDILTSKHNPYGLGAVAVALQENRADIVPLLIDTYKADVNDAGLGQITALHVAVSKKMTDMTTTLLDQYSAEPTLTAKGQNLLHMANLVPGNPVVPILLKRFPKMLSQKDNDGDVPLMYVVRNRDAKTLAAFAKVEKKADVNAKNNEGISPLAYSVRMNYESIATSLRKIR